MRGEWFESVERKSARTLPAGRNCEIYCAMKVAKTRITNRGTKAALKSPHSRRFANTAAIRRARERLECGGFRSKNPSGRSCSRLASRPFQKVLFCVATFLVSITILVAASAADLTLRYNQPAPDTAAGWERQALPIGNGRIG